MVRNAWAEYKAQNLDEVEVQFSYHAQCPRRFGGGTHRCPHVSRCSAGNRTGSGLSLRVLAFKWWQPARSGDFQMALQQIKPTGFR